MEKERAEPFLTLPFGIQSPCLVYLSFDSRLYRAVHG